MIMRMLNVVMNGYEPLTYYLFLNVSASASGRVKVLSMFPHPLEGRLKKAMTLPILAMILLIFHGGRAGLGLTN